MFFFLRNPILWGNLVLLFIPNVVLIVVTIFLSYVFLYPPQAVLAFVLNGPTGVVGAFIAMLQQAVAISRGLSELFLLPKPLKTIFDGVLVQKGSDKIVLAGRQPRTNVDEPDFQRVINYAKAAPRKILMPVWLFKLLIRVALNFVPILGPVALIFMDAPGTAERCLGRYFELRDWDEQRIRHYMRTNWDQCLAFGFVAAGLESLPFTGFAFTFTNTAGGALWAADIDAGEKIKPGPGWAKRAVDWLFF